MTYDEWNERYSQLHRGGHDRPQPRHRHLLLDEAEKLALARWRMAHRPEPSLAQRVEEPA